MYLVCKLDLVSPKYLLKQDLEAVGRLLDAGASNASMDNNGMTAEHYAKLFGFEDFEGLLKHGSKVNTQVPGNAECSEAVQKDKFTIPANFEPKIVTPEQIDQQPTNQLESIGPILLQKVLNSPLIGPVPQIEEYELIKQSVDRLIHRIAEIFSELSPRFSFKPIASGSVSFFLTFITHQEGARLKIGACAHTHFSSFWLIPTEALLSS